MRRTEIASVKKKNTTRICEGDEPAEKSPKIEPKDKPNRKGNEAKSFRARLSVHLSGSMEETP